MTSTLVSTVRCLILVSLLSVAGGCTPAATTGAGAPGGVMSRDEFRSRVGVACITPDLLPLAFETMPIGFYRDYHALGSAHREAARAAGVSPRDAYLPAIQYRATGDTPETRAMLRGWTITPAQMDSVVKTYRRCTPEPARIGGDGRLAVIRYPIAQRACAPFFFQRIGGAWALDLTMMQRAIRFGRSNAWRFDHAAEHPYRFAFTDWRFDQNGFPSRAK